MSGNGFALIAAVIKLISSFILQWQTSKDHENITNAEKDWKMELEKRELLQVLTPHGAKLEKRTQMKYKKERIGKQSILYYYQIRDFLFLAIIPSPFKVLFLPVL